MWGDKQSVWTGSQTWSEKPALIKLLPEQVAFDWLVNG